MEFPLFEALGNMNITLEILVILWGGWRMMALQGEIKNALIDHDKRIDRIETIYGVPKNG